MKTLREQLTGKCRHFNGVPRHWNGEWEEKSCKAGVRYYDLMRIATLGDAGCICRIPCTGDKPGSRVRTQTVEPCDKYEPMTEEEIQARIDENERFLGCLRRNVSTCCDAPIDESQVIPDGEHKGHGPRYCSQCHKLLFMV